jgi:AcrR family transcriptional regulator
MVMGAISTTDAPLMTGAVSRATDERIRAAALACIARTGITRTTVDDIVGEAGVSRATLYRAFPGGKDTLVEAVLGREVHRFFAELSQVLAQCHGAEDLLAAGVGRALRFLTEHPALRAVLAHEPGLLLSQVAFHRLGPILDAAAAFAAPFLRPHVRPGHPDPDTAATEVAELLVRVVLTYALEPSAHVDPTDDASVTRLVRQHLLPALTA